MKPFKTHRQQLSILRDRGLTIQDGSKAMRILEKENYYSLINGYKDLFLQVDLNGEPQIPEKYKSGATFDEIYKLFCLDRDLRNTLLEYLLKFESNIKSKISYRFSEKYKEPHAYLVMKNYSRDPKLLKDVLNLIATISNIISTRGKKNTSINHYLDKHDGVPLWVLAGYFTMGNVNYFYKCLTPKLQNVIAKDFAIDFNRDYHTQIQFTSEMLENILKTANHYRNVCAHEERLYSFKIQKPSKSSSISQSINVPTTTLQEGNLFTIICFLKMVISKTDHKTLVRKLENLFAKYESDFSSVSFQDILQVMGFEVNWRNLLP
ncbi:Abi family protein [Heyndrickxia oleronia]|jgi:abortive infection bacteriophage resistance protein|uniref:Abi family protein n=1 Tax=Heyndrickxia oleronia TaxID=38875 RepID=UPI002432615C|nr:Abi family protein [Heyndrickxia oleronia]MCI1592511.1 Abi family protein [Heyndrickxia oleronia]MCI1615387.1 Abi family protein [Heyndrickxia oleronia]MCI1746215.1 Abi family protein [Heyndrickxia oleronia]MCI1763676.1 Abi family protein [Heyndrickxia oleronia]